MGQNMVGFASVRLRGKKDSPVTMRFAEVLKENGTELYVDNLRGALVRDIYTPSKDGLFTWEPTFVYHGFRFIEISGLDVEPTPADITGKVVYDEMATIGSFDTSNDLIDRIHKNAYWGIRGNYRGMPTDCPQRDERMGWLGDRATGAYGESFLFGNALLYNKWLVDIEESMSPEGVISDVSPRYWTLYSDNVTWPSAYFNIADMLYRQFGDPTQIRDRYPSMKKWVDRIAAGMTGYIVTKDTYGDWCMPPESPELIHSQDPARRTAGPVLSTTVYYSILGLMQKFAVINGLPEDAAAYADLAAKIKEAYNAEYFDPATARYDNNTVTANLLSLQLGLVPEGYEERVFANIVEKTEVDCKGHVSAGVLGIQHLMRGLTEHGALDLAYRILTNETYPSWGYMIRNDATTIWELWNGNTADPAMNSHNHVMLLGDLLVWFYENLAGIRNDPSGVAFKKIAMEPVFPDGLDHVTASYDSPHGVIESAWKRDGDILTWNITIPANTTATVRLPARFGTIAVTGGSSPKTAAPADGTTTIDLGSGKYTLRSE
jgi:alpha-L-rhamnosidase